MSNSLVLMGMAVVICLSDCGTTGGVCYDSLTVLLRDFKEYSSFSIRDSSYIGCSIMISGFTVSFDSFDWLSSVILTVIVFLLWMCLESILGLTLFNFSLT